MTNEQVAVWAKRAELVAEALHQHGVPFGVETRREGVNEDGDLGTKLVTRPSPMLMTVLAEIACSVLDKVEEVREMGLPEPSDDIVEA